MKKLLSTMLAALLMVSMFAGCTNKNATDWEYIENKKELVVGITLYEPMNYYDENGKLIGFDTEFAEAVSEIVGVPVKFQEIRRKLSLSLKQSTASGMVLQLQKREKRIWLSLSHT